MGSTVSVILGLVLAVLVLVLFTVKLKIHPFFALIATSATFAIVAGMNMQDMLSALPAAWAAPSLISAWSSHLSLIHI